MHRFFTVITVGSLGVCKGKKFTLQKQEEKLTGHNGMITFSILPTNDRKYGIKRKYYFRCCDSPQLGNRQSSTSHTATGHICAAS